MCACFLLQGQFFVETCCMHPSWWEGSRDENILCGSNGVDSQITRSYFLWLHFPFLCHSAGKSDSSCTSPCSPRGFKCAKNTQRETWAIRGKHSNPNQNEALKEKYWQIGGYYCEPWSEPELNQKKHDIVIAAVLSSLQRGTSVSRRDVLRFVRYGLERSWFICHCNIGTSSANLCCNSPCEDSRGPNWSFPQSSKTVCSSGICKDLAVYKWF